MVVGIIPARFASSRLLGKPLAKIGDKPMLQHTFESASKSKLIKKIIIAVDDIKVQEAAQQFCDDVILTPKTIKTGSDRLAFVVNKMPKIDIIVNIQGDEPFINGKMIDEAIEPLLFDKNVHVSTLAKKIDNVGDLNNTSIPKVVFDYSNNAMYFSRYPIPFMRNGKTEIYKHIGLYVYRKKALLKFTNLEQTDLEKAESLEQLRMLENGMKIKIVVTEYDTLSVDTQEDLTRARSFYKKMINYKK